MSRRLPPAKRKLKAIAKKREPDVFVWWVLIASLFLMMVFYSQPVVAETNYMVVDGKRIDLDGNLLTAGEKPIKLKARKKTNSRAARTITEQDLDLGVESFHGRTTDSVGAQVPGLIPGGVQPQAASSDSSAQEAIFNSVAKKMGGVGVSWDDFKKIKQQSQERLKLIKELGSQID